MFISELERGETWTRGNFLMLCQERPIGVMGITKTSPICGIVRRVKMQKFGHFMMGDIRVGHYTEVLSGTYGQDGLICDVPPAMYRHGVQLPSHLVKLWETSTGHNGPGHEGQPIREWAYKNMGQLSTNADMAYDRTTLDQTPDLDDPKSFDGRFLMTGNIDKAGLSYVTLRSEWVLDAFRSGSAAFEFKFGLVRCSTGRPVLKSKVEGVTFDHPLIMEAQSRIWVTLRQSLARNGWTAYYRDPQTTTWTAPEAWLPVVRYNMGFS
jgi:hypothetical protein